MSGVQVILSKLLASSDLTTVVPSARIVAGEIPEGTALPALSVMLVSSVPRLNVRMAAGARETSTDRVQVSVLAKSYPQMRQIMRLVRAACPHVRGTVDGIAVDSIIPELEGPDFFVEQLKVVGCTRDFRVVWSAAT